MGTGKKGENLVCAAVSVLLQSFLVYCKKEGLLKSESMGDGLLEMELQPQRQELTRQALDLVLCGLESLQKDHPKEMKILYKI